MAEASDKRAMLYENLCDAGCTPPLIEKCLSLANERQPAALLRLLAAQKANLLDEVHANQKRIDCLDFLVYQIKRGNFA